MKAVLSEKEHLAEEVQCLQNEVEGYKALVYQQKAKLERYRSKYSHRKRYSEDRLASSLYVIIT